MYSSGRHTGTAQAIGARQGTQEPMAMMALSSACYHPDASSSTQKLSLDRSSSRSALLEVRKCKIVLHHSTARIRTSNVYDFMTPIGSVCSPMRNILSIPYDTIYHSATVAAHCREGQNTLPKFSHHEDVDRSSCR